MKGVIAFWVCALILKLVASNPCEQVLSRSQSCQRPGLNWQAQNSAGINMPPAQQGIIPQFLRPQLKREIPIFGAIPIQQAGNNMQRLQFAQLNRIPLTQVPVNQLPPEQRESILRNVAGILENVEREEENIRQGLLQEAQEAERENNVYQQQMRENNYQRILATPRYQIQNNQRVVY